MEIIPASQYDILFICLAILILAIAIRKLQHRVESLYINHKSLSQEVWTDKKTRRKNEDVVD